jgi:hypothetical protein
MKIAFGAAACAVALGLPAVAAPHFVPHGAAQRFGIERTQANPDIGKRDNAQPGQGADQEGKAGSHARRRDPEQNPDDDGDDDGTDSNGVPSPNPAEPPGCVLRKGPLDLIV